jgi:hypothetical protein
METDASESFVVEHDVVRLRERGRAMLSDRVGRYELRPGTGTVSVLIPSAGQTRGQDSTRGTVPDVDAV